MKHNIILGFIVAIAVNFTACNASKVAAANATETVTEAVEKVVDSKLGDWDLHITGTPIGDVDAKMQIEEVDGKLVAKVGQDGAYTEVADFKVEGNKLTGSFYNQEYGVDVPFDLTINEDGKTLKGTMMDGFEVTGKKN